MWDSVKGEEGAVQLNCGWGGRAKFKSADLKICINYVMNSGKINVGKD